MIDVLIWFGGLALLFAIVLELASPRSTRSTMATLSVFVVLLLLPLIILVMIVFDLADHINDWRKR